MRPKENIKRLFIEAVDLIVVHHRDKEGVSNEELIGWLDLVKSRLLDDAKRNEDWSKEREIV